MKKWFEKKLGWGLGRTKRYFLKKLSIPDKTRGMDGVAFVKFDTKCNEKNLTYEKFDEIIKDLQSKKLVKKASLTGIGVATTREGDNLLRNRKIIFLFIYNLVIVAPIIYLNTVFSQDIIIVIIIGLVLANIYSSIKWLFGKYF